MEQYHAMLRGELRGFLWMAVGMLVSVVAMSMGLLWIRKRIGNKRERVRVLVAGILLLSALLLLGCSGTYNAYKIQKDLKNELYLTYYGAYTVARERSFTVCYIYDGDRRIELRCTESVKEGSHLGHVVYSKNSLYAVEIY